MPASVRACGRGAAAELALILAHLNITGQGLERAEDPACRNRRFRCGWRRLLDGVWRCGATRESGAVGRGDGAEMLQQLVQQVEEAALVPKAIEACACRFARVVTCVWWGVGERRLGWVLGGDYSGVETLEAFPRHCGYGQRDDGFAAKSTTLMMSH